MTITISRADHRPAKAALLATTASQWLRCRMPDGRKFYGIESASRPGHFHLTNQLACSCEDYQRRGSASRPCYHVLAVRAHVARLRTEQAQRQWRQAQEQRRAERHAQLLKGGVA